MATKKAIKEKQKADRLKSLEDLHGYKIHNSIVIGTKMYCRLIWCDPGMYGNVKYSFNKTVRRVFAENKSAASNSTKNGRQWSKLISINRTNRFSIVFKFTTNLRKLNETNYKMGWR